MKKCMFKIFLILSLGANIVFADCFEAKSSTFAIAQQIRQEAKDMGWKIGKIKSISIAGIIKSKKALYPDGDMKVCIEEKDGDLKYIMKSSSKDAGKPTWHFLSGSKKGLF